MTEQQHPITPPPELLQQWAVEYWGNEGETIGEGEKHIATQAARWGADQELEACINYFHEYDTSWGEDSDLIAGLRAARRPKPPSLKEQALALLDDASDRLDAAHENTIRRALEALPE